MITAWITAIATTATVIAIVAVELSRRRYERKQIHSQQIKDVVLTYLKSILSDYYLSILDRKEGFLKEDSETSLFIKLPSLSLASTLGEQIALQEHESTYPHLYKDVKDHHLSDVISKLEQFEERFQKITNKCLELALQWTKKIEDEIHLPPRNSAQQQDTWVNYLMLAVYMHENLWGVCRGYFRIEKIDDKYGLYPEGTRWGRTQCGKGTKEEMEKCQHVVNSLIDEERELLNTISKMAEVPREQALSLKKQIESLILEKRPFKGTCSYI